jgi:predicted PhzF superfamily epimerase YddE/YHI9
MHVLRVFTADDGSAGNPLGVFLDGAAIPFEHRQAVAADVGFSETVFVDDLVQARVQIFDPASPVPFAGHPMVGTGWLIAQQGHRPATLRPTAGPVDCWTEGEQTWIRGRPDWGPRWDIVAIGSPAEVDALDDSPGGLIRAMAWAWEDEPAGHVRARVFAMYCGVFEDPATGSAAMRLAGYLGRNITVRQGQENSVVRARVSAEPGFTEVGGRTAIEEVRDYDVKRVTGDR